MIVTIRPDVRKNDFGARGWAMDGYIEIECNPSDSHKFCAVLAHELAHAFYEDYNNPDIKFSFLETDEIELRRINAIYVMESRAWKLSLDLLKGHPRFAEIWSFASACFGSYYLAYGLDVFRDLRTATDDVSVTDADQHGYKGFVVRSLPAIWANNAMNEFKDCIAEFEKYAVR